MRARLLASLLALMLAGCASLPAGAPVPTEATASGFVEWSGLEAEGLPDQRVTIWLPPEYAAHPGRRFPVLYMWDGQNLFDPAQTHYGKAWLVQDVLGTMVAKGQAEPHIVVGIWSPPGADRYRVYLPQKVAQRIEGPVRADMERMAGGAFAADAQLAWVADRLKPRVDREFRTRSEARDTSIVGASMGGLMACYAAIERPRVFARAGCVSVHFALANPDVAAAHPRAVTEAWSSYLRDHLGKPEGRRIWMDHGTVGLDASYAPWQRAVAGEFAAHGWRDGTDHTARAFQGAEHDENFWRARMPDMLAWLWRKP